MFLSTTNFENYIKWKRIRASKMQDNIVIWVSQAVKNPSHMVLCMKLQKYPDEYILSNHHRVRQQKEFMASQPGCLFDIWWTVQCPCTVLHRWDAQQDSQRPLKNGGNFPLSYEPECIATEGSPNLFSHQLFTKCNARQLEAMCHIPQTVTQPPGYDCVAV